MNGEEMATGGEHGITELLQLFVEDRWLRDVEGTSTEEQLAAERAVREARHQQKIAH